MKIEQRGGQPAVEPLQSMPPWVEQQDAEVAQVSLFGSYGYRGLRILRVSKLANVRQVSVHAVKV